MHSSMGLPYSGELHAVHVHALDHLTSPWWQPSLPCLAIIAIDDARNAAHDEGEALEHVLDSRVDRLLLKSAQRCMG